MINPKDFDLNTFILGKPLNLKTKDLEISEKELEISSRVKKCFCLIAPPGTGLESFLRPYKDANPEQVFICNCQGMTVETIFGDLMMQIGFGHKLVNWYETPVSNIVEALIYFLHETNNRTILIFNHCDNMKLPQFRDLLSAFTRFKGQAGIMFRITPSMGTKIINSSDPALRHHIAQLGKLEIGYPTPEQLLLSCHENGIISRSVAEGIVKDTLDFDVVCSRVETLRSEVRDYIQKNVKQN